MKKTVTIIAAFALLAGVVGCNSAIDKKVELQTLKEDLEQIKQTHKDEYTAEDYEYLSGEVMGGVFVKALSGEKIGENTKVKFDKTYKFYLDEAKTKRLEYEKKMSEYKAEVEKFKNTINAGVIAKKVYGEENYELEFALKVEFENKSNKAIKGAQGYYEVYDMFDKLIYKLNFELTSTIAAKEKLIQVYYWKTGFSDEMQKIAYADLTKLNFKYYPETIIYEDGTKETAPPLPEK